MKRKNKEIRCSEIRKTVGITSLFEKSYKNTRTIKVGQYFAQNLLARITIVYSGNDGISGRPIPSKARK